MGLPTGSSLPASTVTSHASSASTLDTTHPKPVKMKGRKPSASHNSSSSNLSTSDAPVPTNLLIIYSSKWKRAFQRRGEESQRCLINKLLCESSQEGGWWYLDTFPECGNLDECKMLRSRLEWLKCNFFHHPGPWTPNSSDCLTL